MANATREKALINIEEKEAKRKSEAGAAYTAWEIQHENEAKYINPPSDTTNDQQEMPSVFKVTDSDVEIDMDEVKKVESFIMNLWRIRKNISKPLPPKTVNIYKV